MKTPARRRIEAQLERIKVAAEKAVTAPNPVRRTPLTDRLSTDRIPA